MQDSKLLLELIAIGAGLAVQTWLIIRYILDRMDSRIKDERHERLESETGMKVELTRFRNEHVRRDDFLLHMDNVNKQVDNLVTGVQNLTNKLDNRMDTLMTMIAAGRPKDGNS